MGRTTLSIMLALTVSALPFGATAQTFTTGALESPIEEIEAMTPLPRARSPILLSKVDLTPMMPAPRSQGRLGSCTGWAIAYAGRSYYMAAERKSAPDTDVEIASPAFQYNHTALQAPEVNSTCGGAYMSRALEFMRTTGSLSLRDWPYNQQTCRPNNASAYQLSKAAQYKVPGYRRLLITRGPGATMHPFKEALQAGHPVMVAMEVFTNWYHYRGGHTFSIPSHITPPGKGYHAIIAVGYDDSRQAVRLQNSWGSSWGDDGYMWIDYQTFLRFTREAYVFTGMQPAINPIGHLVKPTPTPTPTPTPKPWPSPSPSPSPTPSPTPTPNTLLDQVKAVVKDFPAIEFEVTEIDGRVSVVGHGCADAASRARTELQALSDRLILAIDETPWPACETRGLLEDAIDRGGVDLKVTNISKSAPNSIRGITIGRWADDDDSDDNDKKKKDDNIVVTPVFRDGDDLSIEVELESVRPFLQLFYVQADQSAKEVFRGMIDKDEDGKRKFEIGTRKSGTRISFEPPFGTEAVIAIAGTRPLIMKTLPKNAAESDFMDGLRTALDEAEKDNYAFAASVMQMQVVDRKAQSSNWVVTPDEYEALKPIDPFNLKPNASRSSEVKKPILQSTVGPKIEAEVKKSRSKDGDLTLKAVFKERNGVAVDPSTVSVKYRSSTGWFDVTDRVRRKTSFSAEGFETSLMALPAGSHTLRVIVLDDEGNEGIVDIPVTIKE